MKLSIAKIREALIANRGGLSNAKDTEVKKIWDALDDETQKKYLESIKKKETTNAHSS
ncbi:MAG: hypothetical protein JXA04_01335 [Gammaproteobacteria bacterium]|nr:hypothetical protein [Gammaproteobacteria bacterium]